MTVIIMIITTLLIVMQPLIRIQSNIVRLFYIPFPNGFSTPREKNGNFKRNEVGASLLPFRR